MRSSALYSRYSRVFLLWAPESLSVGCFFQKKSWNHTCSLHLHIFTYSLLHIFTSSHLHIFTSYISRLFSSLLCSSLLFSSLFFLSLLFPSLLFSSRLVSSRLFSSLLFSSLLCSALLFSSLLFPSLLFSSLQNSMLPKYGDARSFLHISWHRCLHWLIALKLFISIPLQHLRIILRGFHQVTSQRRLFHWNHHPL